MEGDLGDAVAARLALAAGLDLAAAIEPIGRLRASVGSAQGEFMVMLFARQHGLGLELRRLARTQRELAPVAGDAPPTPADGGERLGNYVLGEKLGEGGYGEVYRARHAALEKPVAIKVLHGDVAASPRFAAALLREGRLASRVQCAGIVGVSDFGTTADGRPFLVMELVPWPTLRALLAREAPLPPARALALGRGILLALQAAHDADVLHRDLKPENVFVGPQDEVKVGDFGAAYDLLSGTQSLRLTREGTVCGSPHYLSPERCKGERGDRTSDLYAVGCMVFEMLEGRVPYDGMSAMDVMAKHVTGPVPALRRAAADAPEELAGILARALAKRPAQRYQSAGELMADLDRCAADLRRRGWQRWLSPSWSR